MYALGKGSADVLYVYDLGPHIGCGHGGLGVWDLARVVRCVCGIGIWRVWSVVWGRLCVVGCVWLVVWGRLCGVGRVWSGEWGTEYGVCGRLCGVGCVWSVVWGRLCGRLCGVGHIGLGVCGRVNGVRNMACVVGCVWGMGNTAKES